MQHIIFAFFIGILHAQLINASDIFNQPSFAQKYSIPDPDSIHTIERTQETLKDDEIFTTYTQTKQYKAEDNKKTIINYLARVMRSYNPKTGFDRYWGSEIPNSLNSEPLENYFTNPKERFDLMHDVWQKQQQKAIAIARARGNAADKA